MSVRDWSLQVQDRVNARSKWTTYTKRKRVWAAAALSLEGLVLFGGFAWLFGGAFDNRTTLVVVMSIGLAYFVVMVWSLAIYPERAPGWFMVWGTPLLMVGVIVATVVTEVAG